MKFAVTSYYIDYIELANNAVKSFAYLNPNYEPFLFKADNFGSIPYQKPEACLKLFELGFDKIVCLGADTFTISECQEFEDMEHDCLGSMSIHHSEKSCNLELPNNRRLNSSFRTENYINADVLCFNSKEFLIDFHHLCKKDELHHGYWDQDYICWLFNSDLYNCKIIDKTNVCYNESGRSQWLNGEFRIDNNKVILNDGRELKILHWAGAVLERLKTQYHIDNWYLNNLKNGLNNICLDILEKSKDIKPTLLEY
jgi:hypothetical protein